MPAILREGGHQGHLDAGGVRDRLQDAADEGEPLQKSGHGAHGLQGDRREELARGPGRLDDVQTRLSSIRGLQKKYGDTIEQVLAYCAAGETELAGMENWEEEKQKLESDIAGT